MYSCFHGFKTSLKKKGASMVFELHAFYPEKDQFVLSFLTSG